MSGLHLCWTGNFESLKQFVAENIEVRGDWKSPGSDKKIYSDGFTSISWKKSKMVLQIEGKDMNQIKSKLCSIICERNPPTTSVLSEEVEGLMPITEKDILSDIEELRTNQTVNNEALLSLSNSVAHLAEAIQKIQENVKNMDKKSQTESTNTHNLPNNLGEISTEINEANNANPNLPTEVIEAYSYNNLGTRQSNITGKHLVPCPFLRRKGFCKKGSRCDFLHNVTYQSQHYRPAHFSIPQPFPNIPPPFPNTLPPLPNISPPPMHHTFHQPPYMNLSNYPFIQPLMKVPIRPLGQY